MGNIHFKMGQYNKAIKYYRMALDQVWLSSWISSSCLKEILSGAKYAQNNAHQDYAQHWGPLCQNGWDLFFLYLVGERYCQFVSLQVNITMLAPLLNGSCQSRYFIFFKFLRGDNSFPPPHPKRAISSAKTTAQYISSKTRATSKPASTWSCVTTPPETKTGWRRASPSLWRFRLRFEVPCDETVGFSAL